MSMLHRTNLHGVNTPQPNNLKTPQKVSHKYYTDADWFSVTALHKLSMSVLNDQSCIRLSTLFMSMLAILGHIRQL